MRKVIIIGSGRIGKSIAKMLLWMGGADYQVTLADQDRTALDATGLAGEATLLTLDITNETGLLAALESHEVVISACGYDANPTIARAAARVGLSYFDLTEDVATTALVKQISEAARPGQVFVPQCGLAPGFIGIMGAQMASQFDELDTLKLRVGALPEFPTNNLMYNLTWSTQGLINEYCNPCQAIKAGEQVELTPLEGLESFSLDGINYEAFNTSGGLGSLCETLAGRVNDLTYKTVRYKGHQYLMNFLINDLRLGEQRKLLMQIFERSLAVTWQDVVLTMVTATGKRQGQFLQQTDYRKVYHGNIGEEHWSAIQIATASGICALLDLYFEDRLPGTGYVRQEQVESERFLQNRFAGCFKRPHHH